ncbi:protease [Paraconexibacter sp. AEG42_29]|uniref:Protease n=2 Tax=Paraconexibacter sp. AEG42_29 TaxID=2997339 RepID=A0AAU7AQ11_9ACTN
MLVHRTLLAIAGALVVAPGAAASASTARVTPDGQQARPARTPAAVRAAPAVADPMEAEAWHLATDTPMGIRTAWQRVRDSDVIVAVLDSGIDLTHPDLAPNLWTNAGEIPGNRIDDDRDGVVDDVHGVDLVGRDGDPADDNGHGTHVAGIIGARGGNGEGASGVAWRVRLMAVKVLDRRASGTTGNVAQGIRYAVAHGARIINVSLAGPIATPDLVDAVEDARAAGVLVVAAAGNAHQDLGLLPSYPASLRAANVLGVAATTEQGLLSLLSSFGTGVDLSAPGDAILSTALGGGYEYRSGTSMAAPMVAGAAALLLAVNPAADAVGVAAALAGSARRTGLPVGAGALDVGRALGGGVPTVAAPARAQAKKKVAVPRKVKQRARKKAKKRTATSKTSARKRVKATTK